MELPLVSVLLNLEGETVEGDPLLGRPCRVLCLPLISHPVSHPSFPPSPSLPPPSTPPHFLLRKGQIFHEYQQNMAYQVAVRLNTSRRIKTGQGDPVWGVGSQTPAKELETVPLL